MLKGDFYTIISAERVPGDGSSESYRVLVRLDPKHRIYGGHFPGNPVVPGVCQVQMAREALEHVKGVTGLLSRGDQVKFLNMIVPSEHPDLTIDLTLKSAVEDSIGFSATISDGSTIFMKFKGALCTRPN